MPTEFQISLSTIVQNYRVLQKRFTGRETAAVIKAGGYGLGAPQVGKALVEAGCKTLFVSYLSEANELRDAGVDAEIYILHGITSRSEAKECGANNFIPILNNSSQADYWPKEKPCGVHFDTGMTRLGFDPRKPELLEGFNIKMVMTHLAAAEEPDFSLNRVQLNEFNKVAKHFPNALKSMVNSSGIFLGTDYHFDLARPGIALFGGNPVLGDNPMQNVVTLHAPILQIHNITDVRSVGYSATHQALPGDVVATVACGYADILPCSLANKGKVYIGPHACPIIGRVSMDLITISLNNLPLELQKIGQKVEILGDRYTIANMAEDAGTIEYEILTKLGHRFKKTYV